jgi:hypothetical protein
LLTSTASEHQNDIQGDEVRFFLTLNVFPWLLRHLCRGNIHNPWPVYWSIKFLDDSRCTGPCA